LRAAGGERLSSAVQGFDGIEIAALAERTLRLTERLAGAWDNVRARVGEPRGGTV
jgi:hypothetical protein